MRSVAEEGVAKGCKKRTMEEHVEKKNMKMEEKMNGKLGKTKENRGNRWENEEIAGRKLWKTVGKLRKRFEKKMKWKKGKALKN